MWIITLSLLFLFVLSGVLCYIFRKSITIKHIIDSQEQTREIKVFRGWMLNITWFLFIILLIVIYLDWLTLQPL